jgi:hypothetical protein
MRPSNNSTGVQQGGVQALDASALQADNAKRFNLSLSSLSNSNKSRPRPAPKPPIEPAQPQDQLLNCECCGAAENFKSDEVCKDCGAFYQRNKAVVSRPQFNESLAQMRGLVPTSSSSSSSHVPMPSLKWAGVESDLIRKQADRATLTMLSSCPNDCAAKRWSFSYTHTASPTEEPRSKFSFFTFVDRFVPVRWNDVLII